MTEENTELAPVGETGMTEAQRASMLKDDSLGNIKLVHGIMIQELKMGGVDVIEAGDFLIPPTTRIPAGMQGPGCRFGVLGDRPRAVKFDGKTLQKDTYDPASKTWGEISALAATWGEASKGAKVGAELLLWLPDHDRLVVYFAANKERYTIYPKMLQAMREKKFLVLSSGVKPGKNGLMVSAVVREDTSKEAPKFQLSDERRAKALLTFEAYKSIKAAPPSSR